MKILITDCIINNKAMSLKDIVYGFRLGNTPEGIINLYFKTKDKYAYIDTSFIYNPNIIGECITISPIIYENGKDLLDLDYPEYTKHKDYYYISLVIPGIDGYSTRITPLKHEYMVNFIPNSILYNYKTLKSVEVIWRLKQQ
jgi:hypothetical protein